MRKQNCKCKFLVEICIVLAGVSRARRESPHLAGLGSDRRYLIVIVHPFDFLFPLCENVKVRFIFLNVSQPKGRCLL